MAKHKHNNISTSDNRLYALIHTVRLELEKGPAADEEAIQDAYKQIAAIMEISVEEVEKTIEKGLRDYDRNKRRNRWMWAGLVATAVAVVIWRAWWLVR